MSIRSRLIDDLACVTGWPTREEVADVAVDTFETLGWHGPEECRNEESRQQIAQLAEAVRRLHKEAHNGPRDSLTAEYCRSEPCVSVSSILDAADVITRSELGPAA